MSYDRWKAVEYAHKWAFKRNPAYLDFSDMGGDCTNFVSQCLRAGGAPMNYEKHTGWYYNSATSRAPAWTSVRYLYQFLTREKGAGLFGKPAELQELEPGDIVQLSFDGNQYSHTLLVVYTKEDNSLDDVQIAAHSYDSDYRPLSTYTEAQSMRLLKIAVR